VKAHDERNLTLSSFFLEVPLFGRKKLANFLLQRGPWGPEKKKSVFKMEVDKELMDLDVSSWSVFETIKLTYHYIFITFYVVFHDF